MAGNRARKTLRGRCDVNVALSSAVSRALMKRRRTLLLAMVRTRQLGDYTIVLFCPLVVEQQAACLMLDEVHDELPDRSAGQTVLYTLGRIASYNVAIAGYPVGEVGGGVSGSMVSEALRDFPKLEAGLLVGIAAGIPSSKRDIRLGDVAVAVPNKDNPGVIGYDIVKFEEDQVRIKQWQNSTHSLLRSAINSIRVHQGRPGYSFTRHLEVLDKAVAFRRPGSPHPDSDFLVSDMQQFDHRDEPIVHYGTILSGNGVIKSKAKRDELRDKYDGIAIEMEAAGMTTRLPVAVIRGISDFANSDKNDEWHAYAAITAAAYAKEMLMRLGPLKETGSGREAELAKLEKWLSPSRQMPPQKSVVSLWGLGGVGKSQLVSEFHILSYVDTLPYGSIVLITRSKELAGRYYQRIEVKGLDEEDAAELLGVEIDEPFQKGSQASVLSNYPISVAQYIEQWKQRQLDESFPAEKALSHSFDVSFEELESTNPLAAKFLMLFGFLDHRDMWYDLCLSIGHGEYPDWLRQMASKRFDDLYIPIRNLSFVEAKPNDWRSTVVYEIHPAIHDFARRKARERGDEEEYRLEPHADQCKIYLDQGRGGTDLDLVELEKFGNLFRHLGRYEEASGLYETILSFLKEEEKNACQPTIELMAGIENNLGLVYHARRQYDLALRAFDRSYQRRLKMTMGDNSALMVTLYNKGRSLLMLGRLDDSLQMLQMAAAYFAKTARPNGNAHVDHLHRGEARRIYFRILNDIGEVRLRLNDTDQAERAFRVAFDGQKKYLDVLHPAAFAIRLNMGRVCVQRSRFATAEKIFEYIIATYTRWWGRRHSETMRAVAELADCHARHGEMQRLMGEGGDFESFKMAAQLWAEILQFHRQVYGASSDTAVLASSKLQRLQLMLNPIPSEDPYSVYYFSAKALSRERQT
ncbi:tetratricopeptide repeat domain protein [Beauveria bassiana ARSEF 2860]|uniref:Tetratricopeptide repeat domain protein n=1 Tax=Beauveria bassiana (strain ARSEF 2860) TaxID=655819 RepID=J5JBP2_BEAB2|nr:tetratricopeptide repeat domain protein [Beauveria bassiana ARSEF 2860]EJP61351.1 tetratricopeptide repeat domain protein [Beauveria bassiana ARSEF 2860]